MIAGAADASPPVEWQGLLRFGMAGVADASLRRLKRLAPPLAVFKATGFGLALPVLQRGNPDLAADIYRGRFVFEDEVGEVEGGSVFDRRGASEAWLCSLHGFAWLQHLQAGGRELSRVQARAFVTDWLAARRSHPPVAFKVGVAGRRVISWLRHALFLVRGCSPEFQAVFLAGLTAETRALARNLLTEPNGSARLTGALALAHASLGLEGLESLRASALARLVFELEGQILPDGGHRSRSPEQLLDLLIDLEPVRMALEAANIEVPADLNAASERMLPMLRFFTHADGGLATFNGVRDSGVGKVKAVLEADTVQGRPLNHAVHSGYCRLSQGSAVAIADVGRPPAPGLNSRAGAGPLSFEFSDGGSRLVVNCGTPASGDEWTRAASLTAAHSTVCLGDQDACAIIDNRLSRKVFGTPALLGPRGIQAKVDILSGGSFLEARHDGYVDRYGIAVERRLWLPAGGGELRGEDRFLADLSHARDVAAVDFAIRFHLHPSVKATLSKGHASVMLMLADRMGWRFSARGGDLSLEDSVYLTSHATPRRTQQIVIRGVVGRPDRLQWAFKRIEKRAAQPQKSRHDTSRLL